jgi:hypothetical protein
VDKTEKNIWSTPVKLAKEHTAVPASGFSFLLIQKQEANKSH